MFAMTSLEQLWILDETEGKLIATANHKIGTRENTKEKKALTKMDGWMEKTEY
jgi:hypothetical protein